MRDAYKIPDNFEEIDKQLDKEIEELFCGDDKFIIGNLGDRRRK
ncbi:MAG: hypothetical protein ABSD70_07775 [Terracidiphilus sp.]|jgi:hypothetical protein